MGAMGISEYRVEQMQPSWLPTRTLRGLFVTLSLLPMGVLVGELVRNLGGPMWSSHPIHGGEVPSGTPHAIIATQILGVFVVYFFQALRRRLMKIDVAAGVSWSWRAWVWR